MAEVSQKVTVDQEEVSRKSPSSRSNLGESSHLNAQDGKHRGSKANLSMTNYSTMVSEEKDKYIDKLRHRNLLAQEKIQDLENANADFWKTIQQQQDLLETFEKKMEEQETQFKKEINLLRTRKNEDIRKLKNPLGKETEGKVKDEKQSQTTIKESNSEKNELESLSMENARLKSEVERLTNLVDLTAWKGYTELPQVGEEDIREKLEDKEEELQAVGEGLIIAKSVPTSPETGVLDCRSEPDIELDKINLLKENEVTKNVLNEEMKKSAQINEELWLMGLEVKELKQEKLQLVKLLQEKELNIDQQLHEILQESEKSFREELNIRENELRKSIEGELAAAKRKAEKKTKEAKELAQAYESLSKQLEEKSGQGNETRSNQANLNEETESEKMKALRREHQQAYNKLLNEVATLRQEREWIRVSKMSTISSLSHELERLRES